MSNVPNHRESEQEVLNEARNSTYGAIDTILQVETSVGVTTPAGYQAPLPVSVGSSGSSGGQVDAHPVQSDGTSLVDTQGGQTYEKVGIVADGDKYVRGNVAEGAAVSDPVYIGVRDASGNAYGIRAGQQTAANSVPVILPSATITTLTPPAAITGFATSAKQDTLIAKENLDGTGTHGTRDLTSANTWYAVPSTVPTAAYILIAQPRTGNAGTIRWSFLSSGTPGAGTGLEIQGNLVLRLAANESVVFASTTAGDDIDWTCKEIV